MYWIITIVPLVLLVLVTITLVIITFNYLNFFFQILYTFICDHETWKKYQRLKKYLKTDMIPVINILDYEGDNSGFAFIQYDNIMFIIQGANEIYISSYYSHLIKDLLKRNNQDSPNDYESPWEYLNNQ